jgi:hypothetical protein
LQSALGLATLTKQGERHAIAKALESPQTTKEE